MRRIIDNRRDQKIVSLIYLSLMIGIRIRPEAGAIMPYIESTTILDPNSIALIYAWCAGFLWRTTNLMRWKYAVSLLPLLITSLYLMFYMIVNPETSLLTGILSMALLVVLISNLQYQAVRNG